MNAPDSAALAHALRTHAGAPVRRPGRSHRMARDMRAAVPAMFGPLDVADAGLPRYRAIKRALLALIDRADLRPGDALPGETALARAYGVAVGTLRQAIGELVAEQVLVRRQGLGTYVADTLGERFLFRYFQVERSDGLREQPQVSLLGFQPVRLQDDEVAQALRLRPGTPAFQFDNRLSLQGRPIVHDRITVPAELFQGLTEQRLRARPGTVYQLYQAAYAITIVRAQERARAVLADDTIARTLGLRPGAPVLQVRRTALSFGDRPVEFRVCSIHTAAHDYVNTLVHGH